MSNLFLDPVIINGTVYMASDFHFGSPNEEQSKLREEKVIAWMETISRDATAIFLLGDIFDFWFEYKDVVPCGYFNFFAQLDKLRKKGIEIYYFTGNHDMWVKDYFTKELGVKIFRKQQPFLINGKKCLVGHGDGLGPKDFGYKFIKRVFAFRPNITLYGALHPRIAFALARFFSRKSRSMTSAAEQQYMGDEREMLTQYAISILQNEQIDYFMYGHRHLPINKQLSENSRYINTGDWLTHDSFVKMEEGVAELIQWME
ncbi:UDP-2,3-diacylglucosamine diphosphatase [Bacteroidales bacterium OttesenSCG-928-B11]|nr:UDP-2,3-diacylglucosamine diphosphatase [Bacteroidales bacterium OttesenSCG-928-E04]MDL2313053.1 UDP-2,3-diacylglucosamine diphosphatase [Bacteroidales bacterium OttesenSCG-928-B11]MDL2326735.1 UDP-2,3-diacylglucosamine diphosphatase [Bacteroidales bacterium OttesenSCG-928-A14]